MNQPWPFILGALFIMDVAFIGSAQADRVKGFAPNDGQTITIVTTANNGEIAASQLAVTSATSPKVRDLAQMMVKEHTAANANVEKLTRQTDIQLGSSPANDQLKKEGSQELESLKKLSGAQFDAAYVDDLVKDHQSLLKELTETLIPSAQNFQLKSLLMTTRNVVEDHLVHAREVQSSLTK